MIKANELRIGNCVNYKSEHFIIKGVVLRNIIDNDGVDCVYEDMYAGYSIKDIYPILLTPEILKQCGFEMPVSCKDISKYFFIGLEKGNIYLQYERQWDAYVCDRIEFIHIKYLHQLQNLYFALTGEELKVNLNVEITN